MFDVEQSVYRDRLDGWLRQRLDGWFAVIKGKEVLGTETSFDGAMRTGIQKTRSREFFVQRIQPSGTEEWMSHIAQAD